MTVIRIFPIKIEEKLLEVKTSLILLKISDRKRLRQLKIIADLISFIDET